MTEGRKRNIPVILCTIAYRDRLLDYVLEVAADLGFAGVEIWGREPHISEQFDENRVEAVRRMLDQRGLAVPVLGSYLRFGVTNHRTEGHIELEDTLHTARCLGTPIVRVWASDVPSAEATEAVWQATVNEIREACVQAGKLGITFAAEMHAGTLADTALQAKRLAEEVSRDNFRLNYQVADNPEPYTPLERLQIVLPYVVHMHTQNFAPGHSNSSASRAALAAGEIDYAPLIKRLKAARYRGCVAVEFAWGEGEAKRDSLAADLAYLRTLIDED